MLITLSAFWVLWRVYEIVGSQSLTTIHRSKCWIDLGRIEGRHLVVALDVDTRNIVTQAKGNSYVLRCQPVVRDVEPLVVHSSERTGCDLDRSSGGRSEDEACEGIAGCTRTRRLTCKHVVESKRSAWAGVLEVLPLLATQIRADLDGMSADCPGDRRRNDASCY